jgi:hypothetical protein
MDQHATGRNARGRARPSTRPTASTRTIRSSTKRPQRSTRTRTRRTLATTRPGSDRPCLEEFLGPKCTTAPTPRDHDRDSHVLSRQQQCGRVPHRPDSSAPSRLRPHCHNGGKAHAQARYPRDHPRRGFLDETVQGLRHQAGEAPGSHHPGSARLAALLPRNGTNSKLWRRRGACYEIP